MKFFFKPIGTKENHISQEYNVNLAILFADNPTLSKGDWLFLYAVGHQKMIGISLVHEDNPVKPSGNPRFKFEVSAFQILPTFCSNWFTHNVNPLKIDDDFTKRTGHHVTIHKDSLTGALQRGNTKFEITQEFALELLKEMVNHAK